jgi:hypothetical protein
MDKIISIKEEVRIEEIIKKSQSQVLTEKEKEVSNAI